METTGVTEGTNEQRYENLKQEADNIISGIFEEDNVSQEFTQQLKTVIMAYLDSDTLIQVDVENVEDDAISCSVFSDDGVHKFLYQSEEEWGGMFFGREEIDHAFYVLNDLDIEDDAETPIQ